MDEKRLANLKELLRMRKEVVSEEEYKGITEKYRMDEIDPKFTDRKHKIITGRAAKLAQMVIWKGGSKAEVKTAILNTMICMDAMKHKLDWARWKRDNDIALLARKYMAEDAGV